jgi:hypothetical protein
MLRSSLIRQVTQSRRSETTKRLPFSSGQGARSRSSLQASELWEDWDRAQPFTAGNRFFNLGETHEVAFAADTFGSVHKIPEGFDGWEDLARSVEKNYVRGWVAKDGSLMFLWDDFSKVVLIRLFQLTTRGRALSAAEPKAMVPC